MPKINVLSKQVSELIAAGEVVERPASVIKELIENSIDAKSTSIIIEIQNGGIKYMRITDNGCGISSEDVPLAFLRHATSKIKSGNDLDSISTLGFRGEALAAISSVSMIEMFTKSADEQMGTHYRINGGTQEIIEEAGCPDGTTIIIRDIFYNTPARMKFLKKDTSEANAIAAVVDRIALSHPDISFKFLRDGKQTLSSPGDGKIDSVVYSVLGREFAGTLIKVDYSIDRIETKGLTCKPVSCRSTRNNQFTFLNGRLVRSGTVTAAVEQAYKNSSMIGKFPGFVLYITVPFDTVDVNVHPSKTEVRFSNEKIIFDSVYSAIKNALNERDSRPQVSLKTPVFNQFQKLNKVEYKQQDLLKVEYKNVKDNNSDKIFLKASEPTFKNNYSICDTDKTTGEVIYDKEIKNYSPSSDYPSGKLREYKSVDIEKDPEEEKPIITIIGEAFKTYIIAQMGTSIYMIDKHAAHERIIFNNLKKNIRIETQNLISPETLVLRREEYDAIISNLESLNKSGFEIEEFGESAVLVRSVPATLVNEDISAVISEIADSLNKNMNTTVQKVEDLYHIVSCKAAIKAGYTTPSEEMKLLAERVLYSKDIMYCPHGRPVAFEIKKHELEKQFGRIQ